MDTYEKERDFIETNKLGIDETSSQKGHKYVTVFVDMSTNEIIDVQEGKDSTTVERFVENYTHWDKIKSVSIDMSSAFIKGVKEHLPDAKITFDKFHVVRLVYNKLDPRKKDNQWGIRTYLAELFENVWKQKTKSKAAAFLQFWIDFASEKGFNKLVKSMFDVELFFQ